MTIKVVIEKRRFLNDKIFWIFYFISLLMLFLINCKKVNDPITVEPDEQGFFDNLVIRHYSVSLNNIEEIKHRR